MECGLCRDCQRLGKFITVADWGVDSEEAALLTRALTRVKARNADAQNAPSVLDRITSGAAVLRMFYTECGPRALYVLGFSDGNATIRLAYSECGVSPVFVGLREALSVTEWMGLPKLQFFSRRGGWARAAQRFGFKRVSETEYEQEVRNV